MPSKIEKMIEILKDLETSSPDIEASAIVSNDGFIIASVLPRDVDEDRVGAMAAAILSLGERSARELNKGEMEQTFVKGSLGYVIISSIEEKAVLATLASEKAKLGLIFLEMKRTIQELLKYL